MEKGTSFSMRFLLPMQFFCDKTVTFSGEGFGIIGVHNGRRQRLWKGSVEDETPACSGAVSGPAVSRRSGGGRDGAMEADRAGGKLCDGPPALLGGGGDGLDRHPAPAGAVCRHRGAGGPHQRLPAGLALCHPARQGSRTALGGLCGGGAPLPRLCGGVAGPFLLLSSRRHGGAVSPWGGDGRRGGKPEPGPAHHPGGGRYPDLPVDEPGTRRRSIHFSIGYLSL